MNHCIAIVILILFHLPIHAQNFSYIDSHGLPKVSTGANAWGDVNNDGYLDVVLTGLDDTGNNISGLFKNNSDGTFLNMGVGLPPVIEGAVTLNDLNNDGWLDIILAGATSSGNRISKAFRNNTDYTFTEIASFEGVTFGRVVAADFNNDMRNDIFITGINNEGKRIAKLYGNNGLDSFSEITTPFEPVSHGGLWVADFNNDGYKDVIFNGVNNDNRRITNFYVNNRKGGYAKKITDLTPMRSGDIAAADFDNDGYLDVALSGIDNALNNQLKIFKNNQGQAFVEVKSYPVNGRSIACGDYDNDGYSDVIVSGYATYLYHNNSGIFEREGTPFLSVSAGHISWADYNNDHKLDILLTGKSSNNTVVALYQNGETSNTPPSPPENLSYSSRQDSVIVSWRLATDTKTQSRGLSYNVSISSVVDGESGSDIFNTDPKIISQGNSQDTFAIIKNLPEGKYYWKVKAIDPSFASSAFSEVDSFTICNDINLGSDTILCPAATLNLLAGTDGDQVHWFSSRSPVQEISSGNHFSIAMVENAAVWAIVDKPYGCLRQDTILLTVNPANSIDTGNDLGVCIGDSVHVGSNLSVSGSLLLNSYQWYPSETLASPYHANPAARPLQDTKYRVIITPGSCAADTAYIFVKVNALPLINAGDDVVIGMGETVSLTATGGEKYIWQPDQNVTGATTANPFISPTETRVYLVTGYDSLGCHNTDTVNVIVQNNFFVPDLFTPNNDGMNDDFIIHGFGIKEINLKIYNKSGILLYETNSLTEAMQKGWDGRFNGIVQNPGAYSWSVTGTYADGTALSYRGKNAGMFYLVQ